MPGRLRAVVCRGMEQVQAVLVEAQRAESVAPARKLNVLGELRLCPDMHSRPHQDWCKASILAQKAQGLRWPCSLVLTPFLSLTIVGGLVRSCEGLAAGI